MVQRLQSLFSWFVHSGWKAWLQWELSCRADVNTPSQHGTALPSAEILCHLWMVHKIPLKRNVFHSAKRDKNVPHRHSINSYSNHLAEYFMPFTWPWPSEACGMEGHWVSLVHNCPYNIYSVQTKYWKFICSSRWNISHVEREISGIIWFSLPHMLYT